MPDTTATSKPNQTAHMISGAIAVLGIILSPLFKKIGVADPDALLSDIEQAINDAVPS